MCEISAYQWRRKRLASNNGENGISESIAGIGGMARRGAAASKAARWRQLARKQNTMARTSPASARSASAVGAHETGAGVSLSEAASQQQANESALAAWRKQSARRQNENIGGNALAKLAARKWRNDIGEIISETARRGVKWRRRGG